MPDGNSASDDQTASTYLDRWGLEPLQPPVRTPSSTLIFVQRRDGTDAVLKIFKPVSDEALGATALLHFGPAGAVRVLNHAPDAVLLERLVPGTSLNTLVHVGGDDEAIAISCDVIKAIQRPELPSAGFPSIEEWGHGFAWYRESCDSRLPPPIVAEAKATFFDLAGSQDLRFLLHGDLHHDNILFDHRLGWRAIDPKGVIGEASYETGAMLRNPAGHPAIYGDPRVIDRRVSIFVERLGLDRQRVLAWNFVQFVLSQIWIIQDGGDLPADALQTIETFANVAKL